MYFSHTDPAYSVKIEFEVRKRYHANYSDKRSPDYAELTSIMIAAVSSSCI